MRLIDADKLKAHYSWWKGGSREMTMDEAKSDFDTIIDLQPTVDAEPTKHGRWLRTDAYPHRIYCSECYATFIRNDEFLHLEDIPHNYCPNCGARMDAQIGEDKSHPFAESVMMGMDGGEE